MAKPLLRFPEFTEDWETLPLSELVDRVTRKNTESVTDLPLTISSLDGLVDQREYFTKSVASKDMSGYYLLKKGEFAYNKSYSAGYDYGSIKRLEKYDCGALSTLYICFSVKNPELSDILVAYFDSLKWNEAVSMICAEGARNHGLLNVPINEFFDTPITLPPTKEERDKITQFLAYIDSKIENQKNVVQANIDQKNGLMQQIFSQKISFKDKSGSPYKPWKYTMLSTILHEHGDKYTGTEEVYSVSVSKGLVNQIEHLGKSYAAESLDKYAVVHYGDVVYTKSPTGEFKWGIVKQSKETKDVVVSPLYGVFTPENFHIGNILQHYFSVKERAHNYLITLINKGAKNTINITNTTFLDKGIMLPTDEEEQKKISKLFDLMDSKIEVERQILENWYTIKKGLLQQMFI